MANLSISAKYASLYFQILAKYLNAHLSIEQNVSNYRQNTNSVHFI
jgi:hypothetical protein